MPSRRIHATRLGHQGKGFPIRWIGGMHTVLLERDQKSVSQAVCPALRFEGALFAHHSLAVVNRELASRLFARGHGIEFARIEADAFAPQSGPFARLAAHVSRADV